MAPPGGHPGTFLSLFGELVKMAEFHVPGVPEASQRPKHAKNQKIKKFRLCGEASDLVTCFENKKPLGRSSNKRGDPVHRRA